ncbi:MAG TPA: class I SAM-dependent methyltransferase [Candidatus Dormibacteraeota bacterium]|nr:class I SAM-dependent methyltransferase [Candidatus Dormibacteraeota bacterium]
MSRGTLGFRCRSCGSEGVELVLSLGETPLANALIKPDQLDAPEPVFPLDLAFCSDCSLVQITFTVPPERLFSEYPYLSSVSDTMLEHARQLTAELGRERRLSADSLVIEIASNDGYLLQNYLASGIPVLGIEPARNIALIAEQRRVPTIVEFFGSRLGVQLAADGHRADVIHAHNVLAHVADLNGVIAGIYALLKDDGIAVIEVPYVRDLIDRLEFDTIYHEHLCYFSVTALDRLLGRHDMRLLDVQRLPIHGGSLRVRAGKRGIPHPSVAAMLGEERAIGMTSMGYYSRFGEQVRALRKQLVEALRRLKAGGNRIAAYGASAKGSTLLNYIGIGSEVLDFVADRSVVKQGLFTPGTRLPVVSPDVLLREIPDYALLLVWNFADEVLRQQHGYRERGGRFIIPVPHFQIV